MQPFHYRVVWFAEQAAPVVDDIRNNNSDDGYTLSSARFSRIIDIPSVLFAVWQQLDACGEWKTLNTYRGKVGQS